ncbi:hypothetical protein NliqN6_4875 [Naganishia liquefaciens]|uniref:TOG domain-containing protein n=1 Tax=Naganishia liquefaciens TaxID=104408 RepID=A0A8H3TX64_9TREE|nr:hypothetical protein NliqN6_4875 [Naganishia liquefaciens]
MDPNFYQGLHTLLEHTLAPDTNVIKQATAELNMNYYKNPQCIPALFEASAQSGNQGVRQLAANELRKRVWYKDGKMWGTVPAEFKARIKQGLLERCLVEPIKIVRHALGRAVAAIADVELYGPSGHASSSQAGTQPLAEWPELFPFLTTNTQAAAAEHREVAIFILHSILESVRDTFVEQMMDGLFNIFAVTLNDQSEDVRLMTLRALGKMAEFIDLDEKALIARYQALIPGMLQVLHQTIALDNVDGAKAAFDVFETLLILETPLIAKHCREYADLCLAAAGKQDGDDDIRVAALNSLTWLITYKKTKVQTLGLAGMIIERLLPIGCEGTMDPNEDEEDVEEQPSKIAFRTLDELAKALPPSQVFPVLSGELQKYATSSDPRMRKAALMAFGVTVEGVSEYIRPHIAQLWPLIDAGLADADPMVRKAGCIALACTCEWLADECAERHEHLVPTLFNLVSDASTQKAATACLEAYLEILGDNIAKYLTLLMEKLLVLLETAPTKVKITVTGAIGSAAFASKEGFRPYFEETIKRIAQFFTLEGEGDEASLRGVALDTLGTFAEVVGKDMFRPYFQELMNVAQHFITGESRLKESALLFFGTMAGVYKEEFAPYVQPSVQFLLASVKQSEMDDEDKNPEKLTAMVNAFNAGTGSGSATIDVNGDEDDADEDYEDLENIYGNINSEIAIEKEISFEVLGQVFEACPQPYLPQLQEVLEEMFKTGLPHFYEGIRKATVSSLLIILRTFYEMQPAQEQGVSPQVQELIDLVMPKIMEMWENEDDKQVVILLCSALQETINTCGQCIVEGRQDEILNHVKLILEKKSECQIDLDEEEDSELLAESSEYESVLISNAMDVAGALCSTYGPAFAPKLQILFNQMLAYADSSRPGNERAFTIGSLGEVITGLQSGITQYTQPILAILSRTLQDSEAEVRSNSAFAAGALIEWSEVDLSPQFGALFTALSAFFKVDSTSSPDEVHAKDNAAGCIARMIIKNAAALPLEQILPVWLGGLPLTKDFIENKPVFDAIFLLFEKRQDVVQPHLAHLLAVSSYVLQPAQQGQLTDETQQKLEQLLMALRSTVPAEMFTAAGIQ